MNHELLRAEFRPQPFLGSVPPRRTYQSVQIPPVAVCERPTSCAVNLLEALWRSPDLVHQLWFFERKTGKVGNVPVQTIAEAMERGRALSDAGIDAYFACAEYVSAKSRKAENVSGTFALWMDLDCGEEKYAKGKGYRTIDDALAAVKEFCRKAGFAEATHVVESGGGLHFYWVLDQRIERQQWQMLAAKLKSLTKALGLLADDSRTADIASVLRVPDTLNYKTDPPKPVSLRSVSEGFIRQAVMLESIDLAYGQFCGTASIKVPSLQQIGASAPSVISNVDRASNALPDLRMLASALKFLPPDCDDEEWKFFRIAPLATLAKRYPAYSKDLRELARSWSEGNLWVHKSWKWVNAGSNGLTGKDAFDAVWQRFLISNFRGRPRTVATIYQDAQNQGWRFGQDEQFEAIAFEVQEVQQ